MKKVSVLLIVSLFLIGLGCKKDENDTPNNNNDKKGTMQMKISDARGVQPAQKSTNGIITASKLTKFEISVSSIQLKNAENNLVSVLSSATKIDLRSFRGTAKELLPVELNAGQYKGIVIKISGVNITYDNNNYQASIGQTAQLTVGSINQTITSNIPNVFTSELSFEIPYDFQIKDTTNTQGIRLFFDAEASCKELPLSVPIVGNINFAIMRENPNLGLNFRTKHTTNKTFAAFTNSNFQYK